MGDLFSKDPPKAPEPPPPEDPIDYNAVDQAARTRAELDRRRRGRRALVINPDVETGLNIPNA